MCALVSNYVLNSFKIRKMAEMAKRIGNEKKKIEFVYRRIEVALKAGSILEEQRPDQINCWESRGYCCLAHVAHVAHSSRSDLDAPRIK